MSSYSPAILGGEPVFSKRLSIAKSSIFDIWQDKDFQRKAKQIFKSGMLTNGKNVLDFEKGLARVSQTSCAVATSNCTTALMLILNALGVKGREVILPSFTFSATAHAVEWCGAKLVFADIDRETFNVDPEDVEKKITKNTAAIIGVHIFGNPCDIFALKTISHQYQVPVIYDAAHAIGASVDGFGIGAFGEVSAFSFSPTKLITAMEGGAVVTNNPYLAQKIKLDREYSQHSDYHCDRKGLSGRLSEFSALVASKQLGKLQEIVKHRANLVNLFQDNGLMGIKHQKVLEGDSSSYKDLAIIIEDDFGLTRDEVMIALEKENISTRRYFSPAVHELEPYKHYQASELPNTEWVSERVITLPLHNNMMEVTMQKIWEALSSISCNVPEIKQILND